jgi:hypothetical protein
VLQGQELREGNLARLVLRQTTVKSPVIRIKNVHLVAVDLIDQVEKWQKKKKESEQTRKHQTSA